MGFGSYDESEQKNQQITTEDEEENIDVKRYKGQTEEKTEDVETMLEKFQEVKEGKD